MSQRRILVIHSSQDDALCRALVQTLRQAGANVWDDEAASSYDDPPASHDEAKVMRWDDKD
jgi:predicted esterase